MPSRNLYYQWSYEEEDGSIKSGYVVTKSSRFSKVRKQIKKLLSDIQNVDIEKVKDFSIIKLDKNPRP